MLDLRHDGLTHVDLAVQLDHRFDARVVIVSVQLIQRSSVVCKNETKLKRFHFVPLFAENIMQLARLSP